MAGINRNEDPPLVVARGYSTNDKLNTAYFATLRNGGQIILRPADIPNLMWLGLVFLWLNQVDGIFGERYSGMEEARSREMKYSDPVHTPIDNRRQLQKVSKSGDGVRRR